MLKVRLTPDTSYVQQCSSVRLQPDVKYRVMKNALTSVAVLFALGMLSCARGQTSTQPTAADAKAFLDNVNQTMLKLGVEQNQAGWVQQTYITDDTDAVAARANQRYIDAVARFVKDATRFDKLDLPPDQRRQLNVLKTSLVMVTPSDPKESEELTTIMARLESAYGKGKWCTNKADPDTCQNIDDITKLMANDRDPQRLRAAWEGWHTISPQMKNDYARFVDLSNKGAREIGFADTGAMWRSKYDMPARRAPRAATLRSTGSPTIASRTCAAVPVTTTHALFEHNATVPCSCSPTTA